MSDRGHELTDELIEQLEKKIAREYSRAYEEVSEKLERYLKRFEAKDEEKRKQLDAGEITKEEYAKWRTGQILSGQRWAEMKDTLAEDLKKVDTKVRSIIGDHMPDAYALNHNYATFAVEKDSMLNTSYTLYNRRTVENLLKDDENLLPYPRTESKTAQKLRERADLIWNRQKINDSITQGVLQGEPIRDIAKRLQKVVGMDGSAAVRNARTMMTAVENKGREDAFDSLEEKGVKLTKVWVATLDDRTRHSHRLLHGEEKDPETGKYSNGLQYPGDPFGDPEEVYNCRCSEIAHVKGFPIDIPKYSPKMGDMTYDEWLGNHKDPVNIVDEVGERLKAAKGDYIRFGEVPEGGKSVNFNKLSGRQNEDLTDNMRYGGMSVEKALEAVVGRENMDTYLEDGVSVFEQDKDGYPKIENLQQAMSLAGRLDKSVYVVDGNELTLGQDDEPVISVNGSTKVDVPKENLIAKIERVLSENYRDVRTVGDSENNPEIHEFTYRNWLGKADAPYKDGTKYISFNGKDYADPVDSWNTETGSGRKRKKKR